MHIAHLMDMGAKAVVIACNTATGAAITCLREKYPTVPMIGIEPAIKPAAQAFPGGRILVMATPVTLASEKFLRLMHAHEKEAQIIPAPCARLARMVEAEILDGAMLEDCLRGELSPFLTESVDAVVLGCTHYPFVRESIARVTRARGIFDGGAGTARETRRQLECCGLLTESSEAGTVTILNSAPDEEHIRFCERLLQMGSPVMK